MPSLIDLMLEGRQIQQHGPWPRAVVDALRLEILQQASWHRVVGACSAFGGNPQRCIWRSWMSRRRKSPSSAWTVPTALTLRSASITRRRFDWNAPYTICLDWWRKARRIHALGLITTGGACGFPLGDRIDALPQASPYRFLPVEGDGLHQIAVGPVHAGIIEPGHFRFTASGETVVRLEQRLGYAHKGIEGLMIGASLERAAQLAGRVSGDSTVAYAFAFSRAVEAALEMVVPDRAVWLRALLAELERLAHHLGDIGAICNDASFTLMHALCSVLREDVLRASNTAFGHRLMRDIIVPGGVTHDLDDEGTEIIRATLDNHPPALSCSDRTLRQHRIAAGSYCRYGRAQARIGQAVCRWRLRRPRFRSILRRAPDACLSTV